MQDLAGYAMCHLFVELLMKNIKRSSLSIHGLNVFNAIPVAVRNMTDCKTEKFKGELDSFLKKIPDEPLIPGYVEYRRGDSNSILDMVNVAL